MRSGAEELDQLVANASSEARAECLRGLEASAEASAENAIQPFKELERAVQRVADEYKRQVLKERESLKHTFATCALQASFFQGFQLNPFLLPAGSGCHARQCSSLRDS